MDGRRPFRFQLHQVSVDLLGDRRFLVVDGCGFARRSESFPGLSRRAVPGRLIGNVPRLRHGSRRATSRTIPEPSRYFAVKVPASIIIRSAPSCPMVSGAVRVFFLGILPLGKPLPLADDDLSHRRQRLGERLLEHRSHRSLCLSFFHQFQPQAVGNRVSLVEAQRRFSCA